MSIEFDQLLLQEQEKNIFLEVANNDDGDIIDIVSGYDTPMDEFIDSLGDDEDLDDLIDDDDFLDEECFIFIPEEKRTTKCRKGGIF